MPCTAAARNSVMPSLSVDVIEATWDAASMFKRFNSLDFAWER